MNLLDNHVHTSFSLDGRDSMESVVERAIEIGVKYLTFTDHLEYHVDEFSINCTDYMNTILELKDKYKNNIEILAGIEVGYQTHIREKINFILKRNLFDFVLCSTHTVDKMSVSSDKFYKGYTKEEVYNKYFQSILETINEFNNFDCYGHLDYIIRYSNYKEREVVYSDYRDILDIVLKNIIYLGKGIEINTSGYRYGLNSMHPNYDILKRYKELGGEIITIGSDSHRAGDLCCDFDKAFNLLEYIGFKYICKFKERRPEFIEINNERKSFIA